MKLLYDDDLIESVAQVCADGRSTAIPLAQVRRFHAERERLYRILDADERNAAFFRLHLEWFREWGLEELLLRAAAPFAHLNSTLDALAFRKARRRGEEGADLYVNPDGARTGIVTLLPARFAGGLAAALWLAPLLHHELHHIEDMLDPAFGYAPGFNVSHASGSSQRLLRDRYRLLWAITIDGRLTARKLATVASREQREAEFAKAFDFLPSGRRQQFFNELWNNPAPRHEQLASLAGDPAGVKSVHQATPGALCPLCGFPTFHWADAAALGDRLRGLIEAERPAWTPEQGVCKRCVEVLEAAFSHAWPSTVRV